MKKKTYTFKFNGTMIKDTENMQLERMCKGETDTLSATVLQWYGGGGSGQSFS